MTVEAVMSLLRTLPEEGVTEMLCHPGYVDDILERSDTYTTGRIAEVKLLTDPAVREAVRDEGIELVTFLAVLR
jgi:predicted glycoside hydrolase/deacetylase ChbG (UPF0249 family)